MADTGFTSAPTPGFAEWMYMASIGQGSIEFCFRDGHWFTGLLDCVACDGKALDFAYNASLAVVNETKVLRKQTGIPFSIGQIKSLMVNAHLIKRFFDLSGIGPYKTLNAKLVKELFGLATDVA